ncbi:MAG TPA: hypothetical protein PKJ98_13475 [Verrucomicrobiota bacterium]|nr:hypothetical protein [Verrucomicrobiota bacterium]
MQHAAASRVEVAAWTLAVIACHNSPLINGHHFVFHLHLPLCIVGAPVLHDLLAAATRGPRWKQGAVAVLLAALAQSPLAVTWRSIGAALNYQVPTPVMDAIQRLAHEPAGRVYTTPHIGTLVPAYSAHRTYVGHWFLTPDYSARQAQFNGLVEGHVAPAEFIALLERERIRYVLLPPATPPAITETLEPLARERVRFDKYTLALLR